MKPEDVKSRTIRSTVALVGRTVFLQAVSLVALFFLGMFLTPAAVGVFIIVSAVMRVFTLATDLGLGAALIQKDRDIDQADLTTVFTLQEILVLIIIAVGFILTPVVSAYSQLTTDGIFLYHVLLFTIFISSLKAIPSILLERKLAFETQVIPQIAEALVFNVVVVVFAARGLEVAAYSWAVLSSALIGLPIYYLLSPWRVSVGISTDRARHLFSYGIFYQGKNILALIKDDLLTFFLSGLVGSAGIGYWGWWQRWAYAPYRLVVDSVTKVTFPAYARIQSETARLRSGIERSLFMVSIVMFPILALMAVLASRAVLLLPKYAKWSPGLPSFYFLCAGAAISAISGILVNSLDATGRVKTTLALMVMWIVLLWGSTLILVGRFGFTGIAAASFLVSLTIVLTIYLVKRVVAFSFLPNVLPATIGSALLVGTVLLANRFLPVTFLTLGLEVVIGATIYLSVVWILARHRLLENIQIIRDAYHHA